MFLLSITIFFFLMHSNTKANREEVITDEDIKAFEEALADIQRHRTAETTTIEPSVPKKGFPTGLSGKFKKVNARLLTTPLPIRKRVRHRSHLRRLGQFKRKSKVVTNTTRKRYFNFRQTRRKPVARGFKRRRISGETERRRNNIVTRLLQKAENLNGDLILGEEQDIEKAILQALRGSTRTSTIQPTTTRARPTTTTTIKTTTTEVPTLKFTPPAHHRGELFGRRGNLRTLETTKGESTSTAVALEDLIAALERIEPQDSGEELFIDEPLPPTSTTSTTSKTTSRSTTSPRRITTIATTIATTTSASTTIERSTTRRLKAKGLSFRGSGTTEPSVIPTTTSEEGPIPPTTTSFEQEAHLLSLEIEKNFVDTHEGIPVQGPMPPAPPKLTSGFAPPGAEPPSDQIVEELNTADDFLAVARKLQIIRRRQTRFRR